MFALVLEEVGLVGVEEEGADVGVGVVFVVVAHLAKHLHHGEVAPREGAGDEPAAARHRAVQAEQVEGLARALEPAVQNGGELLEVHPETSLVRLRTKERCCQVVKKKRVKM